MKKYIIASLTLMLSVTAYCADASASAEKAKQKFDKESVAQAIEPMRAMVSKAVAAKDDAKLYQNAIDAMQSFYNEAKLASSDLTDTEKTEIKRAFRDLSAGAEVLVDSIDTAIEGQTARKDGLASRKGDEQVYGISTAEARALVIKQLESNLSTLKRQAAQLEKLDKKLKLGVWATN